MKVLLLKDVYKLGRAGDVKKVANGFGRNYLLPQGMAVLATASALKGSEKIREEANKERAVLNNELESVADLIKGKMISFPARAGETGKLYGSVTTRMIAEAILENHEVEIDHRQIESQPIRNLGEFDIPVRLTLDLVPEIKVIVYREGEVPVLASEKEEVEEPEAPAMVEEAPAMVEETPAMVEEAPADEPAEAEETVEA